MTLGYLLRMGKIDDKDRDFLDVLLKGLKGTAGKSNAMGGITYDGDLAHKLREAYDTISKMDKKNQMLFHHLETLKQTYEFFEMSNDMRVLYGN